MIKLVCINEVCGYSYQVSENELKEYGQYHKQCLICGSKIKVAKESLEEVVKLDIEQRVKNNVNEWFAELGIEGTIEMCERNKGLAVYRLYKAEIEKRGFKIKGE